MAFHPFHYFRKHQKAIFAFLTIICMLVFILQFGAGDIFHTLSRNGRNRPQGEEVTTLYGRKVYTSDLAETAERRNFVNQFLFAALGSVLSPQNDQNSLDKVEETVAFRLRGLRSDVTQAQMLIQNEEDLRRVLIPKLTKYITELNALRTRGVEYDATTRKAIDDEIASLRIRYALMNSQIQAKRVGAQPYYFGGYQNSISDLLDFKIWLQQADRLGIELSDADVIKAINAEAGNQSVLGGKVLSINDKAAFYILMARRDLQELISSNRISEPDRQQIMRDAYRDLLSALKDEFRVLLAKEALMGQSGGVRGFNRPMSSALAASPAAVTPDEFYDLIRKKKSSALFALAELPVEDFLPAVQKKPSESELEVLYNAFRNTPYIPDQYQPGFKIPRKIKVEYTTLRSDTPYLKKQLDEKLVEGSLQQVIAPLGFSFVDGGVAGPALAVAHALKQDKLTPAFLQDEEFEGQFSLLDRITRPVHVYRTGTLTFGIGKALGNTITLTPGLGALPSLAFSVVGTSAIYQNGERTKITADVLPRALSLFNSLTDGIGPLALASRLGADPIQTPVLRLLDREITFPQRLKEVQERETDELIRSIIDGFREELTRVKGNNIEASKVVDKFIKKYGLEKDFHAMKTPASRFTIEKDPTMLELLKAFNDDPKTIYRSGKSRMAETLFVQSAPGVYNVDSRSVGTSNVGSVLFWRTLDEREREPTGLSEVRDQVEAAWRFIEARELAREEAKVLNEKIAEKAKSQDPKLIAKELADTTYGPEKKKLRVFQLRGNALEGLVSTDPTPLEPNFGSENRSLIPVDKVAFPTTGFLNDIFSLEKPGETKVLMDQPVNHFYLVLLQERNNKSVADVMSEYANAMSPDSFWMEAALGKQQQEYQDMVIRELRAIADPKNLDKEGRYKLPDGIGKKIMESRSTADSGE